MFYNEAITSYPDSAAAAEARKRLNDVEKAETKAKAPVVPRPKPKRTFWLF